MKVPGFDDLTEVGRGGYGVVYKSSQPEFGRDVAIKVLSVNKNSLDEQARRRFARETRVTGKLSEHPNIITLHDADFTPDGQPYLVMPYLPDGSFQDRLATEKRLPLEDVVDMAIRIAGALETAHHAGIVHRDVKPDNILIDRFGSPVLTDFGIAAVTGQTRTDATGDSVTGTIAYVPHEVLNGKRPGKLADVYALAATVFALLAGHPPYVRPSDQSFAQIIGRMMNESAPPLTEYGVPQDVADAVARAMHRAPENRTHSAAAFGQDLQQAQIQMGLTPTQMVLPTNVTSGNVTERTLSIPAVELIESDAAGPAPTPAQPPQAAAQVPTRVIPAEVPSSASAQPATRILPPSQPTPQPVQMVAPGGPQRRPRPTKRRPKPVGLIIFSTTAVLLLAAVVGVGLLRPNLLSLNRSEPQPTATVQTQPSPEATGTAEPTQPVPVATTVPVPTQQAPTEAPTTPTVVPASDVVVSATHSDAAALSHVASDWALGINTGDYDLAFGQYASNLQQSVGRAEFEEGNRTSVITAMTIETVTEDGENRVVAVSFRSNQDPEYGPSGQTCTVWNVTWTMQPGGPNNWQIRRAQGTSSGC